MRRLLLLLVLVLAACGGSSGGSRATPEPVQHAPEISNLSLSPDTAMYMEGDGSVLATVELAFTDLGRDVQRMQVEMWDGTSFTIEISEPINTVSGTLTEEFDVSTAELGQCTVEIWLIDAAGNASNHLSDEILVQNPVPEITTLAPNEIQSGESGVDLNVTGTGFLEGATVTWDGASRTTRYVSDTQVVASILSSDLETPRTVSVRVRNPEPTAGASNELTFDIVDTGGIEPSGFPILVTETIDESPPNGPSVNGGMDWDGGFVTFASKASNLVTGDTNDAYDLFIRDTCLGEPGCVATSTRLVSVGHLGDPTDGASSDPQVSWGLSDSEGHDYHGRFVAFVSSATNLVAGDSNGAVDVFRRDTCTNEPGCTPSTILVSMTSTGAQVSGDSWSPDFLSWYGGSTTFVTAADGVVPGDTNGLADVYVWSGSTRRISVGADGAQTDGASYAPRMSHHFYGPWVITYISEASNILPDGMPIQNDGSIYMDLAY